MNLDEIMKNWSEDSDLDENNPVGETVRAAKLHSKYLNMLMIEGMRYHKLQGEVKKLKLAKTEYYTGVMAQEDLKARGWQPCRQKILKSEVGIYIESDNDVIDLSLKLGLAKQKVEFIEEVIKYINNRGYAITNIVNWAKFKNGG